MTKHDIADIFSRQLALHNITIPRHVLEDAAAQVAQVLAVECACAGDEAPVTTLGDAIEAVLSWRPSDEVRAVNGKQLERAYTVLIIKRGSPSTVIGAGVFSEPNPTLPHITVPLTSFAAGTFTQALDRAQSFLCSPHLDWCGELKRADVRGAYRGWVSR